MRPRHPALILGALVAKLIPLTPVDTDAISHLIEAEAAREAEAEAEAPVPARGADGLGSVGSQAA